MITDHWCFQGETVALIPTPTPPPPFSQSVSAGSLKGCFLQRQREQTRDVRSFPGEQRTTAGEPGECTCGESGHRSWSRERRVSTGRGVGRLSNAGVEAAAPHPPFAAEDAGLETRWLRTDAFPSTHRPSLPRSL